MQAESKEVKVEKTEASHGNDDKAPEAAAASKVDEQFLANKYMVEVYTRYGYATVDLT